MIQSMSTRGRFLLNVQRRKILAVVASVLAFVAIGHWAPLHLNAADAFAVVQSVSANSQRFVEPIQDEPSLSRAQKAIVSETIAPAVRDGQSEEAAKELSQMLTRLSEAQIEPLNHELMLNGLPTAEQFFANSLRDQIVSGTIEPTPIRFPLQLLLTLDGIAADIERTVQRVEQHPANQDPIQPPEQFDDYERMFWEMHVMNNLLSNAEQMARFANELAARSKERLPADELGERLVEALDRAYEEIAIDVARIRHEMYERSVEYRIYRLEDAVNALGSEPDAKQRILAAFVVDSEGEQLIKFFDDRRDQPNSDFARQGLNDADLELSLRNLVTEANRDHQQSLLKGRLLFGGLHWWLRGRYGSGTDYFGLLKHQQAMTDVRARFPLFMPINRPVPTDPFDQLSSSQSQSPTYDRRHHYTWSYFDRQIYVTSESYSHTYQDTEVLDYSKSDEPVFW